MGNSPVAPLETCPEITNFGGTVRFRPQTWYEPHAEQAVLDILRRHRGESIRVVGALHSWSDTIRGDAVVISLRRLNDVRLHTDQNGVWVDISGGCRIKRALAELRRQGDWTLPAIGLITEQTIAGAISTGTHGSGNHSMSHHVQQMRVATFDADTGEPCIVTIDSGPELRAARCSLGCLGVILSVRFQCRPQFWVGELNRRYVAIDDILDQESAAPLQHFFLMPHTGTILAQHRQEVAPVRNPLRKLDYDLYFFNWWLFSDVGLHLALHGLARVFRSRKLIRLFFRNLLGPAFNLVVGPFFWNKQFSARSDTVLTWKHGLFRHIEIEFFVRRPHVPAAARFLAEVLKVFDSRDAEPAAPLARELGGVDLLDRLHELRGSYTHHYPICVRRILPDDTMISMTSGNEDWYSFSLIGLQQPFTAFYAMADFVAEAVTRLFDARLHWGKYFPLDAEYARAAYPELCDFVEICRRYDPDGMFQNDFTRRVLATRQPTATSDPTAAFAS